jgi:hypothetical protein
MVNAMLSKQKFIDLCGTDIRSLGLFRIGLAVILLVDLFIRLQDIGSHYSDDGVLPRSVLLSYFADSWHFSFHLLNGTWLFQLALFIIQIAFAIALLIGYNTRTATVASWILIISLQTRNPLILQGADDVLKMLLFWSMFLPLGACWSIDRWRNESQRLSYQITSPATLALLLQVCFIYWFSALLKSDASWHTDGSAIWYALSNEFFATSIGQLLLGYPFLLKFLTFTTLYLELFGPLFAFAPFYTNQLRTITALIFILFHLVALNLTLNLGLFPYVCAVAWLVFFPNWFWDRLLGMKASISNSLPYKANSVASLFAIFFLAYILSWNLQSINALTLPSQAYTIGSFLRIDQLWNMFAPYPLKDDGWFVIPAKLRNGNEVDLFTEETPVCWNHPQFCATHFKNDRWRSFMMNLLFYDNDAISLSNYAIYLTKDWNEKHPYEENLVTFEIIFMAKTNDYNLVGPPRDNQKIVLWHHCCP